MENTYRLKEGQYPSKEQAHVEVVESVEPKIIIVTEENVLKTIEFLEQKKLYIIAEIDAEIEQNQAMLVEIRKINKDVVPFVQETIEDIKA